MSHEFHRTHGLTRAVRVVAVLSSAWVTVGELAERAEISRRTAYRWLRAVHDAGLPLAQDGDRYKLMKVA